VTGSNSGMPEAITANASKERKKLESKGRGKKLQKKSPRGFKKLNKKTREEDQKGKGRSGPARAGRRG